jgi:hypothetical protein
MDTGSDARRLEVGHQAVPVSGTDYVKVKDRPRPGGFVGQGHSAVGLGQQAVVPGCTFTPFGVPLCKVSQLYVEKPCLDRVESSVVAFDIVVILFAWP